MAILLCYEFCIDADEFMNALFAKTKTSILGIQNCSLTWQLRASWGHFWEILSMLFSPTLLLKPLYWESKVARTVACKLRTSNIFIEGHRQVISLTAGPRFFFLSLRHTKWFIRNVQEWILKNLPWTNRRNQFVPQKDCPCIFSRSLKYIQQISTELTFGRSDGTTTCVRYP